MTFNYQLRSVKKKDGTQSLRLKITTSSSDIQYLSTSISINKNQWDKTKQIIKKHPLEENLTRFR